MGAPVLADVLVSSLPPQETTGLRKIRWAVCAAAPASPELFEYYNALGIPLREGYGQTESTGVIALQRIERPRWGYVANLSTE